jgi:hypothetical protein
MNDRDFIIMYSHHNNGIIFSDGIPESTLKIFSFSNFY